MEGKMTLFDDNANSNFFSEATDFSTTCVAHKNIQDETELSDRVDTLCHLYRL